LAKVIELANKNGIKTIFVAPEFSQKSAKFIATKIGGKVVSMSPLKPNVIENILNIAKALDID
jgi:zinc transport system substrate-binding protein